MWPTTIFAATNSTGRLGDAGSPGLPGQTNETTVGASNETDDSIDYCENLRNQTGELAHENAAPFPAVRPLMLEFLICRRVPGLDWFSHSEQIINVPMRGGG